MKMTGKSAFLLLPVILLVTELDAHAERDANDEYIPENPEVIFRDGPGREKTELFRDHVNEILAGINAHYNEDTDLEEEVSDPVFAGNDGVFGLGEITSLLQKTRFYVTDEVLEGLILELVDSNYEIRRIYGNVGIEVEHERDRSQELVLTLNPDGVLIGARFAMEQHRFDAIINASRSLEDQFRRKQMVSYLERFRTAYNRKDIGFIEQQFSENALIITGTRIETADENPLEPDETKISRSEYRFLRQSRDEYIARLRDIVFERNDFVNVNFEDIKIYQHPVYDEVYGVNLYQIWDSSTYSDVGYLFLMIDYEEETRPKIYVRAWQPEPFDNGRVIDMEMFNLIK